MSLVEQAKQIKGRRQSPMITDELIDLAVAFFNNEVAGIQVQTVCPGNFYSKLANVLREAQARGKVKIERLL